MMNKTMIETHPGSNVFSTVPLQNKAMEILQKRLSGEILDNGKEWITILGDKSIQICWLDESTSGVWITDLYSGELHPFLVEG